MPNCFAVRENIHRLLYLAQLSVSLYPTATQKSILTLSDLEIETRGNYIYIYVAFTKVA